MPAETADEPQLTALLRIEAKQIHRDPFLMGLALTPFMLLPVVWLAAIFVSPAIAFLTLPICIVGAVTSWIVWDGNPWRHERRVRIEVDAESLWVGELTVPRKRLIRGLAGQVDGKNEVWLSRKGLAPDLQLVMNRPKHARALLGALGLDASHSVAGYWTMSRTWAGAARAFGAMSAVGGTTLALMVLVGPAHAGVVALVGALTWFTLFVVPTRVTVGADGVMLFWLGMRRFVSHTEIADVTTKRSPWPGSSTRHELRLTNGRTLAIPLGFDAEFLVERIRDARDACHHADAEPQSLLQRGPLPHAAWVRALRARELVDWRSAAVPNDVLWQVIEDASAPPVERAAAAVALGHELTQGDRERLARAARATAVPKLRVALESAIDAEEERLASMLEGLEEKRGRLGK